MFLALVSGLPQYGALALKMPRLGQTVQRIYAGTSTKRSTAYITKGTKGYVRQDVRETYGSSAWARVGGKGCGYAASYVSAVWSPDSVAESGCVDYNG